MVEGEVDTLGGRGDLLLTLELELFDEVLVRLLGKATALLHVEVDVVNVERHVLGSREGIRCTREGRTRRRSTLNQVHGIIEGDVEANLVILEGDQRERQAGVAVEPELEGNVDDVRATTAERGRRVRIRVGAAHEVVELHRRVEVRRQGLPEVEPLTILAVDDLATDLHLDLLDHEVAQATLGATRPGREVRHAVRHGESDLEVGLPDEVGVTIDDSHDTLPPGGRAGEVHAEGLHGEVRVALVENLPKRDMRIAREIGILSTIGNKLKETTAHLFIPSEGKLLLEKTAHAQNVKEEGVEDGDEHAGENGERQKRTLLGDHEVATEEHGRKCSDDEEDHVKVVADGLARNSLRPLDFLALALLGVRHLSTRRDKNAQDLC